MSERKAIEDRLRKKELEIAGLEEKLKAAKIYAGALRDVLKIVSTDDDGGDPSETKLRAGSAVAQARDIILAREEPVHIDDLLIAMGKEVTRDSKASLAGSLAAYVRREEIFTRPAPNTYGLIELGHTDIEEEEQISPPAGFGLRPAMKDPFDPGEVDDDVPF